MWTVPYRMGRKRVFSSYPWRKGRTGYVGPTLVGEQAGEIIGTPTLGITKGIGLGRDCRRSSRPNPPSGDVIVKRANHAEGESDP